ncbi:putrescine importer [Aneurinibacillus soli]|uniref:Putrescine importer PuuP n=1 Tax=Aneurinibacillus soli TaxID=1500254 RepID=A0A0U5B8P0_9BACL|nr:APC family permease [Aneurinibacillus soli]PYE60308.1 putrescine importer [Aneurinibacillus soli]BAU27292.1 Putrescine importer PuuP [Aneurinibacillus soli]
MEEKNHHLQKSLKLWHIVFIGLGYMAPMAVFDTYGIVSEETGGHVPMAYVLTLAAILFTAASYGKMVRVYPSAGSAYTYTQKTMHPYLGFLVGWAALLDYIFLPMINALLTKIYLSAAFPNVPGWIWIVGFIAVLLLVNLSRVTITVSINAILVLFQFLVCILFATLAIRGLLGKGENLFSMHPFYAPDMQAAALLSGASILCFAFLGFDAVTTLSEETPNPRQTIPRAIFLAALIGGMLFTTVSYFTQLLFPDISVFHDPEAASPEIALTIGGTLFQAVFLAAALTSTLASGIASSVSASRLLYAMGRDRVLPERIFGYVHPRLGVPVYNVVLIALTSLTALCLDLITATSFINFGALTAFTFVNLSVIVHYMVRRKERGWKAMLNYMVLPLIGISFIGFIWAHLDAKSVMLGLAWSTLGLLYLVYMTKAFRHKPPQFHFEETESIQ